jgi:hypothetical protein
MIISASRRTDIPAFYAEWFMNRIKIGHCDVPNPFNPAQISHVSLKPEDVDVIVFWTRHSEPMFRHLSELNSRGYPYYFLITVMKNPRALDPKCPPLERAIKSFCELAEQIGPDRVIWRYDPILFTSTTDASFHIESYRTIAKRLNGYTHKSIISLATVYRKVKKRLEALRLEGIDLGDLEAELVGDLLTALAEAAAENDIDITTCAQERDFAAYGVRAGKCIDDEHIERVFGLKVAHKKDPSQRRACGCVISKDIGMYDTCLFGCAYCYATSDFDLARINFKKHDPAGLSLVP